MKNKPSNLGNQIESPPVLLYPAVRRIATVLQVVPLDKVPSTSWAFPPGPRAWFCRCGVVAIAFRPQTATNKVA